EHSRRAVLHGSSKQLLLPTASRPMSTRIRFAMRLAHTCWRKAPTCVLSRSCLGTHDSQPLSDTRSSLRLTSLACTTKRIPKPAKHLTAAEWLGTPFGAKPKLKWVQVSARPSIPTTFPSLAPSGSASASRTCSLKHSPRVAVQLVSQSEF